MVFSILLSSIKAFVWYTTWWVFVKNGNLTHMSHGPIWVSYHLVERPIMLYTIESQWKTECNAENRLKNGLVYRFLWGNEVLVKSKSKLWNVFDHNFRCINLFQAVFCMIINFVTAFEWYTTWPVLIKFEKPDLYLSESVPEFSRI